ncbi:hypothetical protein Gpo141_00007814 [Globisporangium polare]
MKRATADLLPHRSSCLHTLYTMSAKILSRSSAAERDLRQAMTRLKHEFENPTIGNSSECNPLMRNTYAKIAQASNRSGEEIASWLIPENEVSRSQDTFETGAYGSAYKGR